MIEEPAWGIQRELSLRQASESDELDIHDFPAAWEVRAIKGTLHVDAMVGAIQTVFDALVVLENRLIRDEAGAKVWVGADASRRNYAITASTGRDINAMSNAVHTPFRLACGDRARVVVTAAEDGVGYLLISIDHAYADGYSLALLFEEVLKCYKNAVSQDQVLLAPRFGSMQSAVHDDFLPIASHDDRRRYFDSMREVAESVRVAREEHPVSTLRASAHHRVLLCPEIAENIWTSGRRQRLNLGETIAAGMLAVHGKDSSLPVAYARHGRVSASWFRTPGSAYENVFAAPLAQDEQTFRSIFDDVPPLGGAWATDYLDSEDTYQLRRRASSTFPRTRSIHVPGAVVTAADDVFLEIFDLTDQQVAQERKYELFLMVWQDGNRLFINAHVDPACVDDPAKYIDQLTEAMTDF